MSRVFAERIRYLRQGQGLNQVQLAEKLGVKKQSISNWENDNIMPSIEMLKKIADFFHVSTDYLLGRDEASPGQRVIDVTGLTMLQIEHVRQIVNDIRGS